jgi:GDP-L-fucose synthase
MEKDARIYVAGHRGLVGSALMRTLAAQGYNSIVMRTRADLDLTDPAAVEAFFKAKKPDYVFLAAAKVGGIWANKTQKADFLRDNIYITTNIIAAAARHGVKKLLNLGSTCIYPRDCPQPIKEESLLTGPLEETNDAYALAKIAGIMLGRAYRQQYGFKVISAQPTNLYGLEDNFHPEHGHVIPGMMVRMHRAKVEGKPSFGVWGTGKPLREFLYADDLAEALVLLMNVYDEELHINVGTGQEVSIRRLAELMKQTVGYAGDLVWDGSKPDGTLRKVTDSSRLTALGWKPKVGLEEGLRRMYAWYVAHEKEARAV